MRENPLRAVGYGKSQQGVVRRQFDVLMVWSIDRLGRSVLHVANALAELDPLVWPSIPTNSYRQHHADGSCDDPDGIVFGEQERQISRSRFLAGLDRVRQQGKKLGPEDREGHPQASERREWYPQVAALVGVEAAPCSGRWRGSWRTRHCRCGLAAAARRRVPTTTSKLLENYPDQGGRQSDDPGCMIRPVTVPQNALVQLARRKPR